MLRVLYFGESTLVWITVFANRYYQLLNGDETGYKAVWEEQDAYSTPSKCEKLSSTFIALLSTRRISWLH